MECGPKDSICKLEQVLAQGYKYKTSAEQRVTTDLNALQASHKARTLFLFQYLPRKDEERSTAKLERFVSLLGEPGYEHRPRVTQMAER